MIKNSEGVQLITAFGEIVEPTSEFLNCGGATTSNCTSFVWGYRCLTPSESCLGFETRSC